MKTKYIDFKSISDILKFYKVDKPKHPLVAIVDLADTQNADRPQEEMFYRSDFYIIMCKEFGGQLKYGKSYYDFQEGSLMFTSPGQAISTSPENHAKEGWGLFFHSDLLHGTGLGRKIHSYSFFNYEANEALHISEEEKAILADCLEKIKKEYSQNIDKHTKELIIDNLQLLLNYCARFYDRQFFTREKVSTDLVQKFESLLVDYFSKESLMKNGLPDVKYFASRLNLSSNYLSDLLNRFTGKTTQEHIHLQLIDRAKTMLWGTNKSISEIAYDLGFSHPPHFTKLFKAKTGKSPKEYRNLN